MCNTTDMNKTNVYVDSRNRSNPNGPTENFKVKLTPGIKDPKYYSLGNIQMNRSWYNINSYNNEFTFTDSGSTQFTITLTERDIDITSFLSDLETTMNGLTADVFDLSFDSQTGLVSIEQTTNTGATIDFSNSSESLELRDMLGFTSDLTLVNGTPNVATNVVDFIYTKTIYVAAPNVASRQAYFLNNQNENILFDIPINNTFLQQVNFEQDYNLVYPLNNISNLNEINVKVLDDQGRLVDLNGVNWSFDITLYHRN